MIRQFALRFKTSNGFHFSFVSFCMILELWSGFTVLTMKESFWKQTFGKLCSSKTLQDCVVFQDHQKPLNLVPSKLQNELVFWNCNAIKRKGQSDVLLQTVPADSPSLSPALKSKQLPPVPDSRSYSSRSEHQGNSDLTTEYEKASPRASGTGSPM